LIYFIPTYPKKMSQSQQSQATQKAREFLCLFVELVEKYSKFGLKPCEMKESQVWRYASGSQVTKRLALPELIDFEPF
ncbi:7834_t:CDS:1, partial [Paraglomus brasilianum]